MKNLISVLFAAVLAFGCSAVKSGDATVVFNVTDAVSKEIVLICNNDMKTIMLDEHGYGEIVLPDIDAVYATVYYMGDLSDVRQLYLEGGDKLTVSSDGRDFYKKMVCEGDKAAAVGYLNTVRLTALPDEDYALPFDEYHKKVMAKEADAIKLMKANKLGNMGRFEEMEEGRIKYSFGTQILMYPLGHRFYGQDMSYEPDEAYYDVLESYLVENDAWAGLDQYRDFILEAAHMLDEENRNVTDAYPKAVAQMKFMADRFRSETVRNSLLHYLAYAYVDRFGTDDIQDMENIYRTYVKDTALVSKFDKVCEKWNLAVAGKPSPDFKATDIEGEEYTLADFRGKYVYIDVWATWCGPCRQEIPHLKALEEEFRDAEITFVSLSVDKDKNKWEKMVKEEAMSGVQLYLGTESPFIDAYQITGIPRFILLGKDGSIIEKSMQRPSADATKDIINSLEGIR